MLSTSLRIVIKSMIIGGNIGKNTLTPNENAADDYEKCFRELYDVVDYFAVNVSCPNIKDLDKLQDQDSLREILERIMKVRSKTSCVNRFFLKYHLILLSSTLTKSSRFTHEVGLDGIIATNTTTRTAMV